MGLSRNKVAVPEGAAGSPPFYGEFQASVLEAGVSPVLVEWFHGLAWGCWCGRDHGLGCPVGMSGSGMGMLLGSRTATPQVFCGAVRCPCVVAGPGWLVGSCGAWWFENWIVDASKRNFGFFLLIAISPNSSLSLVSRSIVL